MTTPQELRQAAVLQQAKDALSLLYANSNGNSYDEISARLVARGALSALSAVLEKQDSSHLAACDSEARSGSGVPARPTLPGEDERARFEAWAKKCSLDVSTRPDAWGRPVYRYRDIDSMWEGWQARAALAASPLPQEGPWQLIESAPKDGEVILLLCGGSWVSPGYWCGEGGGKVIDPADDDYPWLIMDKGSGGLNAMNEDAPTHWMPLPAAPGTQGEQKP